MLAQHKGSRLAGSACEPSPRGQGPGPCASNPMCQKGPAAAGLRRAAYDLTARVTAGIDLVVVRVPNLSSVPPPVASVTAGSQEPRRRGALSPLPEQSRGKRQSGRFSCRPGAQGPRALAVIIELAAKATRMLTLCLCPSLCIGSIRSVVLQTSASGSDVRFFCKIFFKKN